jgi:S-adenosylmethionine/arginine decarboxylase-like enzyme
MIKTFSRSLHILKPVHKFPRGCSLSNCVVQSGSKTREKQKHPLIKDPFIEDYVCDLIEINPTGSVNKLPWGWSTSLDIKNCNSKKIKDKEAIKDYVYTLCDLIEMKRFGPCHIYHFGTDNKAGYSMLQLIETSNITGHFCDQDNSAFLDIFSCKPYNTIDMVDFTKTFFDSDSAVFRTTYRY